MTREKIIELVEYIFNENCPENYCNNNGRFNKIWIDKKEISIIAFPGKMQDITDELDEWEIEYTFEMCYLRGMEKISIK